MLAGGNLSIIIQVLPFEMLMIGGAAIGGFLIMNDLEVSRQLSQDIIKVFKDPKWNKDDYKDVLALLYELLHLYQNDPIKLEDHIENYKTSDIFSNYPKIIQDTEVVSLICDTFRLSSINFGKTEQLEESISKRIHAFMIQNLKPSQSLQVVADSLPALGIVAAVLGVIKTMTSIDQPPEILGQLIAGALVGTFLGIFLSYCFVGPIAKRMKGKFHDEMIFHYLIQTVLMSSFRGETARSSVETGRQQIIKKYRPDHLSLKQHTAAKG